MSTTTTSELAHIEQCVEGLADGTELPHTLLRELGTYGQVLEPIAAFADSADRDAFRSLPQVLRRFEEQASVLAQVREICARATMPAAVRLAEIAELVGKP